MTAEVVIMNKNSVAIAADSAATLDVAGKDKISNTSNKLFRLLKNASVGILVYNNSRINGIPWELLIKDFRAKNIDTSMDHLFEYADIFIEYLKSSSVNSIDAEKLYVREISSKVYNYVSAQTQKSIQALIGSATAPVSQDQLKNEALRVIQKIQIDINNSENYYGYSDEDASKIPEVHGNYIHELLLGFDNNLDTNVLPIIHDIVIKCLYKKNILCSYSGIVITGFGCEDYFPQLKSFNIFGIINGSVMYTVTKESVISHSKEVDIIPFAQREVVDTFIMGIHPEFKTHLNTQVDRVLDELKESVLNSDELKNIATPNQIPMIMEKIVSLSKSSLISEIDSGASIGINDIFSAAKHLSTPELAQMAKTLVELTSFRKKVSLETETVGGPVDVAVISKGDGFIWVQRKHYFSKELNEHFFEGYSRR